MHPDTLALFKLHNWPGNFRQLSSLLRTASMMVDADREIGLRHLPDDFLDDVALARMRDPQSATESGAETGILIAAGARLEKVEISVILKSLAAHGGNVSATARTLGVSRNTVCRKAGPAGCVH